MMIDLSIAWHCLQSHIQRPSRCSCLEKGHIPPGNAVVFLTIENTGNSTNELPQKIIPGKLRRPLACDTQHNKLQHLLLTIAAINEACAIAPSQSNSPSGHQGPQSSQGVARKRGERTKKNLVILLCVTCFSSHVCYTSKFDSHVYYT